MCHGLDLISFSPRLSQHSNGERHPAMSILFAKNKNGIRLSFRSTTAARNQLRCPFDQPRAPRVHTWILEHIVQLLLGYTNPQLVFAIHHVNHGVALSVVCCPQVTVRAGTRHVEHREGDIVLHELLDLEPHRRHHLVVLVLRAPTRNLH
eukprot:COSAG03_NODE_3113_length_2215_cov_1.882464_1_plen_150_part_00